MAATEAAKTTVEEGCNRGVLLRLKRAWPQSVGCGHGKTEAKEETGGWDEESIAKGRGMF
jgi:hypothetical protein